MKAILFLIALMSSGCVSYWHGSSLDQQVDALKTRIEQRAVDERGRNEATQAAVKELTAEVQKMREALAGVRDGQAEFSLTVEALQHQFRTFEGKLAVFEHKLGGGTLPAKGARAAQTAPLPTGAKALLAYGNDKKKEGDCKEAVRAYTAFVTQFKSHKLADDALILTADCRFQLGDHKGSISALRTVVTHYADGNKVDSAMLLIHDNLLALKRCKDAIGFLNDLLSSKPGKRIRKKALKRLRRAKKYCKTK